MDDLATTPLTEMLTEYRLVRRLKKKERLAYVHWVAEAPGELADKFVRSVAAFSAYENQHQPFNTKPPAFEDHHGVKIVSGTDFAKRVFDQGMCDVRESSELSFSYVSREPDCLRVAPGRPLDDGAQSKRAIVLDLLLVNVVDRVPIAAEVKMREDRDAAYALIQALAAAAHLATSAQRRRLANVFPKARFTAAAEQRIDVYVLSFDRPLRPLDEEIHSHAMRLARRLLEREDVARSLRRIDFLDATLEGEQLLFTRALEN